MVWRIVARCIILAGLAASPLAAQEARVALVVGNSEYSAVPSLDNPRNDAAAMAERLTRLGFEVIVGYDLDAQGFREKIRMFGRAVDGADVGLFYYAGHGLQVGGRNYLVHSDAEFRHANDLAFEATDVEFVTAQMEGSVGVSVVILDACRDNPFTRSLRQAMGSATSRSLNVSDGLAEMRSPNTGRGAAVIYATSPGDVAEDGAGRHSPFTQALLYRLDEPGVNIQTMMSRVTEDVVRQTNGRQRPWMHSSLIGEVYLQPPLPTEPSAPAAGVASQSEVAHVDTAGSATRGQMLEEQRMLFELARESGYAEDFQAYLDAFPNGVFSGMARNAIARLQTEDQTEEEQAPRVRSASSSDHQELGLTRAEIRVLQARLQAAGQSPGTADGLWGRRTDAAVRGWQAAQGIEPTGYLSREQIALLEAQTGDRYQAHMPRQQPQGSATASQQRRPSGPTAGEAAAIAIIGGIAGGIIGSRR